MPRMTAIALAACPVCRSQRSEPIELGLRRCPDCGCVHAAEYADHDEVFTDGYLAGGTGDFGIDLSHPRFSAYLRRLGDNRMRAIERATGLRGGRLVDVGCGTGELVAAAAEHGWDSCGAEPMPDAAATARERSGGDVRAALLEDSGFPEGAFDVVSAFHVLEHMPDAATFLELLARWAKPGGYIVVESPNWGSVLRERSGEHWIHLRPLEHLIHLTPATLRLAFERAGLEPVTVRTPSHLDRGQTLDEALAALGRPRRLQRLLTPISPRGKVESVRFPMAYGPAWPLLRLLERRYDRRGAGMVVQGVARVG